MKQTIIAVAVLLLSPLAALRPVYHVEIAAPRETAVSVRPGFWKRLDGAQDVKVERAGTLLGYFPVGDGSVYADDLKYYEVEPMPARFPLRPGFFP